MSAVPRATLAAAVLRRALCLARSNHVPTHHAARAPSSTRGQPSPKMVPKFHHPRVHGWRACVTRAASPAVNADVDASTEAEDTRYMRMALDEASTAVDTEDSTLFDESETEKKVPRKLASRTRDATRPDSPTGI